MRVRVWWLVAATFVAWLVSVSAAGAQGLADYDYDNLGFRGIGGEIGYVDPKSMDGAVIVGFRLDLGYLGPNVRVMPRFAFWGSDVQAEEIDELERRLEEQVDLPPGSVDLGSIERDVLIFGADIHWAPDLPTVSPYLGVGADLYVLNGSGPAIDDTFVEDALDLVTAGVSAVGGLEVKVGRGLRAYGELRGTLVTDVRNLAVVGGLMFTPGR